MRISDSCCCPTRPRLQLIRQPDVCPGSFHGPDPTGPSLFLLRIRIRTTSTTKRTFTCTSTTASSSGASSYNSYLTSASASTATTTSWSSICRNHTFRRRGAITGSRTKWRTSRWNGSSSVLLQLLPEYIDV